jgi:hypothetical protein
MNIGTSAGSVSGVTVGGSASNFSQLVADTAVLETQVWIWACPLCPGSATTVAVSGSNLAAGGGSAGASIYEVAGLGAATLDKSNHGSSTSSSNWTSGSITTTQANEFLVGCAASLASGTAAPGSPWSSEQPVTKLFSGQQVVSSTGTYNYNSSGGFIASYNAAAIASLVPGASSTNKIVQANQAVMRAALW